MFFKSNIALDNIVSAVAVAQFGSVSRRWRLSNQHKLIQAFAGEALTVGLDLSLTERNLIYL